MFHRNDCQEKCPSHYGVQCLKEHLRHVYESKIQTTSPLRKGCAWSPMNARALQHVLPSLPLSSGAQRWVTLDSIVG